MDTTGIKLDRLSALTDELGAVRALPATPADERELRALAHRLGLSALCLSGGGIRSAAFNLGVLQALARHGLLAEFDFLSTVSGGGYIGSWLQRMVRERGSPAAAQAVLGNLEDPPPELRELRDYTSYLAPNGGLLSADIWADIVLYLRNVLLNWAVYLPLLGLVVMLAIFYRTLIWTLGFARPAQLICIVLAALCVAASAHFAARDLPDHRPFRGSRIAYATPEQINRDVIWPSLGFAALAPMSQDVGGRAVDPALPALLAAYFLAQTVGYLSAWLWAALSDKQARLFTGNAIAYGAATVVSTALIGAGGALATLVPANERAQALAVAGPFWMMLAFGIHATVFVGLRRVSTQFDLDREWLARLSALKLRAGALWMVFALAALSLSWAIHQSIAWLSSLTGAVMLASGSAGAWLGKQVSSTVGTVLRTGVTSQGGRAAALTVLCAVFVLGLVAMLAIAAEAMLAVVQIWLNRALLGAGSADIPDWLLFAVQAAALVSLLLTVRWLNRRVNVNRYSMHAVYRNRLTRAFLGAARTVGRDADPFTNFDSADNISMAGLCRPGQQRKLFPIINMTLNLTVGGAAAWSERKAMVFTATPCACGAPLLRPHARVTSRDTTPPGVYVRTGDYAGLENPDADPRTMQGLSLATAMAISGAAVSPNWGYHSSPLTAFVMTLFNVRLGAWLPNPAVVDDPAQLRLAFPLRSVSVLIGELLGAAGDASSAIYLSDGGHFENLGLYEVLRRRCRHVIVIDAGEDRGCSFEDLGNALRKSAIDMQISVTFEFAPRIASRDDAAASAKALGYAIATIHYPEPCEHPCKLVYLKPSLLAGVPADVRAYANANPSFPHEPTLDQFFTESQFESYRALGQFQMEQAIGAATPGDLAGIFDAVAHAYQSSPVAANEA